MLDRFEGFTKVQWYDGYKGVVIQEGGNLQRNLYRCTSGGPSGQTDQLIDHPGGLCECVVDVGLHDDTFKKPRLDGCNGNWFKIDRDPLLVNLYHRMHDGGLPLSWVCANDWFMRCARIPEKTGAESRKNQAGKPLRPSAVWWRWSSRWKMPASGTISQLLEAVALKIDASCQCLGWQRQQNLSIQYRQCQRAFRCHQSRLTRHGISAASHGHLSTEPMTLHIVTFFDGWSLLEITTLWPSPTPANSSKWICHETWTRNATRTKRSGQESREISREK